MGLAFAVPTPPPVLPSSPFHDLEMTWKGWDGSLWPLTDYSRGVYLGIDGIEGLTKPTYTQWTQSSPSVAGQWFRGAVADPRKVFWPLEVYSDVSSESWVDLETAFWRTMRVGMYGSWTVIGPRGKRTLDCRFVDDGNKAFTYDPVQAGWAAYGVTLMADQPFFKGDPIERKWSAGEPVDFFNGTSKAAPFNIGSASTFANAKVTNPGDVLAYPVWTIIGHATNSGASVGIGSQVVTAPFGIGAGKALVIDTDPTVQTAIQYDYTAAVGDTPEQFSNPVDRTGDLSVVKWHGIPDGKNVPVDISLTGAGTIRVSITPLYERAW